MFYKHNTAQKDIKILLEVKGELDNATKIQPCSACKHDMEQLGIFLESKIRAVQTNSLLDDKMTKIVKDLSYINELSDIGIFIAKILKPLIILGSFTVPLTYKKVLNKNRAANKIIREHLMLAKLMLSKLERTDEQYTAVSNTLKYFLTATEFKLNADPSTFFLFDKIIRFSYKIHLLSFAGRMIVGTKNVVSCCVE